MVEIRDEITKFIYEMEEKFHLFKYLCNEKTDGFNCKKDTVYYSGPYWDINEKVAFIEAVLTGNWLSAGEYVNEFERVFSDKFNFSDTVMVNSGSSANLTMLAALKKYYQWSDDDEIILSPVGFPTTLAPILQNRMKPVFVEINLNDLNFDVQLIESAITSRTKGIIISPVLGNPPDMDILVEIAQRSGAKLILDNCDSLGSRWRGKYLSDYCAASSCSFYPAHHITTGQGGTVSSNAQAIVDLARSFSGWGGDCRCVGKMNLLSNGSCGKRFSKWLKGYDGLVDHRYVFTNVGYNLRPLDLQGAIGIEQVKKFDEIHRIRRANKETVHQAFRDYLPGIRILEEHPLAESSWFGIGIICCSRKEKDRLVSYFEQNHIQTRNYFAGNLLLHPAFEDLDRSDNFPKSNMVLQRMFFIGCSPTIDSEMIEHVVNTIKRYSY